MESFFDKYITNIERTETIKYTGEVIAVKGLMIECKGPRSVIGEMCSIHIDKNHSVAAEVVGLEGNIVRLMAYGDTMGIQVGCVVTASGHILEVPVGFDLLGRVLDGMGKAYDGKGEIAASAYYPILASPPNALNREMIQKPIVTGVKAVDSLLTVGRGQRLGIFAGSGVGKSTLISMIARNTSAEINVIALVGERNREVKEFIENDLGEEGLKRSVVIVATGDQPSIARLRAGYVATAVAEYFRDQGKDVMLMFDNLTRFAHAQREIALSNGEPPAQHGYPASVFDMLPKLLERSGNSDKGSITAFYAVLVDGDDTDEPISDKVRGIVDGHIFLDRHLADSQHYPAINVLGSLSRLARKITGPQTRKACQKLRQWIATYADQEDVIISGVYQKGNSPLIDEAIDKHEEIEEFLCQEEYVPSSFANTLRLLSALTGIEIPEEEYKDFLTEQDAVSETLAD